MYGYRIKRYPALLTIFFVISVVLFGMIECVKDPQIMQRFNELDLIVKILIIIPILTGLVILLYLFLIIGLFLIAHHEQVSLWGKVGSAFTLFAGTIMVWDMVNRRTGYQLLVNLWWGFPIITGALAVVIITISAGISSAPRIRQ